MFTVRSCIKNCIRFYKVPTQSCAAHKIIGYRNFRTSAVARVKDVKAYENAFAHDIMKNNEKFHVLRGEQNIEGNVKYEDIDLNQNWNDLTADDMLQHLRMIGSYCTTNAIMISDERFDKFVDVFTERCFFFTDEQLVKSLEILIHYPQNMNYCVRNFFELWLAIDDACIERLNEWDFDKILYLCDHWYMLNVGKVNWFNAKGISKMGRKLEKVQPHQLIQMMFYQNVKRRAVIKMFEFEIYLEKYIDELSFNELAIICMGFFKTKTSLRNPNLVTNILKRLLREIDTVQDIPFTCILKVVRDSSKFEHTDLIREVLQAADSLIPRLSLMSCLQVALLGTQINVCHQSCIEQVIRRFSSNLKSLRSKDFARITMVISSFDFETQDHIENQLCQQILDDLRNRIDELVQYPRCLVLTLQYLSMRGFYDEEWMNIAFSIPFLRLCYRHLGNYGKELFALDSYAKINLKETYKGHQLTATNRRFMAKATLQYIPERDSKYELSDTDKSLLGIKETLGELYDHCYFAHALPHFSRPDVIIAYDKRTKTGIDIGHNFPTLYSGTIIDRSMLIEGLNMDPSEVEIINIIIGGWCNFVTGTTIVNGFLKLKMEQSKILGFKPLLIPWNDWERLNEDEQKPYIHIKIADLVQQE